MISKYGQTFASQAEVRRFEQVKPETVKLWKAFEAMREALRAYKEARDGGDYTAADEATDAALALADKVSR